MEAVFFFTIEIPELVDEETLKDESVKYRTNEHGVLGLGAWTKPDGTNSDTKLNSAVYKMKQNG